MPRGQLVSYQIYPLRSHHYPSLLVPLHAPNDHYKYIYFTQTFMAARCKGVKHILSCSFIATYINKVIVRSASICSTTLCDNNINNNKNLPVGNCPEQTPILQWLPLVRLKNIHSHLQRLRKCEQSLFLPLSYV
eukprot:m.84426 g.84426  ORF g.84426 m.84426 type:complete len:134 (+) comp8714_c0_seq17:241-642(+)